MEPGGILDSDVSKVIERLVEKRVTEIERSGFSIITNEIKDNIRDQIKDELLLKLNGGFLWQ